MLQREVLDKLTAECYTLIQQYPNNSYSIVRKYIQMGLCVGLEHFAINMQEVVVLDYNGMEIAKYKSVGDVATKMGIHISSISECLNGKRQSAGGYRFITVEEYALLRRPSEKTSP